MTPLFIFTLVTIALTAAVDWLSYQCISFDDQSDQQKQDLKNEIKNTLGLDEQGIHQFCKASYFIGIALEISSFVLIFYNIKHLIRAKNHNNAAIVPAEMIPADIVPAEVVIDDGTASILSGASAAGSQSDDHNSVISGISLSSASVSGISVGSDQ